MITQELMNILTRYDSRGKVKNNRKRLLKMGLEKILRNISKNESNQAIKLQRKLIGELKEIARLRSIKNIEKLTKEELMLPF